MGKIHAHFHEFNELLPLHGLAGKYSHFHYQISSSPVVSTLNSTCFTLLHVPTKPINDTHIFVDDSFVLTSQCDGHNHSHKPRKGHHKCDHCGKLGHKIKKCYALHYHFPNLATVVHTGPPS